MKHVPMTRVRARVSMCVCASCTRMRPCLHARNNRTITVEVNGQPVVLRYNDTVHRYQPPRAHHCRCAALHDGPWQVASAGHACIVDGTWCGWVCACAPDPLLPLFLPCLLRPAASTTAA